MALFRFFHSPAGRTVRIIAGVLLLAFGATSATLLGIVALMAGVASIVTGIVRLPHPPQRPRELPRQP